MSIVGDDMSDFKLKKDHRDLKYSIMLVICDPCCCSIVTYLVARLGEALVLAQSYLANPLHLQEISYIKK